MLNHHCKISFSKDRGGEVGSGFLIGFEGVRDGYVDIGDFLLAFCAFPFRNVFGLLVLLRLANLPFFRSNFSVTPRHSTFSFKNSASF